MFSVNPQSYRKKLETAIEQRDQVLLDELEQIAHQSPTTLRMWQEHCLLESAIETWVESASSGKAAKHSCSQNVRVAPRSSGGRGTRGMTRFSVPAISALCCLLLLGWLAGGWRTVPEDSSRGHQVQLVVSDVSNVEEAEVSGRSHSSGQLRRERKPFEPLDRSYDLVDQGRALLPDSVLPPVISDLTDQFAEEAGQTWERISVLPVEMQQVWKELNLPSEDSEDQRQPAKKMPTDRKTSNRFSFFNMLS